MEKELAFKSQEKIYKTIGGRGEIAKETPDVSVKPVRNSKKSLVSTIDFFFPNVQDPYMQGRIACCNVLSDLYAMGVEEVDQVLMVLGVSRDMDEQQQEVVTTLMIAGFDDCATQANSQVVGGQTIFNPWPMIGGVGISAVSPDEYLMPTRAEAGDLIVMTKALGTQVASNAYQWLTRKDQTKWETMTSITNENEVIELFEKAQNQMATLNLLGARLMKKYNAHAATDITGFGLLGHANQLAQVQKNKVNFVINTLVTLKNAVKIDKNGHNFKLIDGYSAETSGGLLIAISKENAEKFVNEMNENNQTAHIIGEVIEGNKDQEENKAILLENPKLIEV